MSLCNVQVHFFEGIDIERGSAGIAFTCTPDGRPKGEAYVEFPSEDAQKEALKRHKNEIGDRYIELFVSSKANMIQARLRSAIFSSPTGLALPSWHCMADLTLSSMSQLQYSTPLGSAGIQRNTAVIRASSGQAEAACLGMLREGLCGCRQCSRATST